MADRGKAPSKAKSARGAARPEGRARTKGAVEARSSAGPSGSPSHDLLVEPLITLVEGRERRQVTLPGVLAALGAGRGDGFARIQAHQRHAWHAFLVQLAAMAMNRAGEARPSLPESRWCELLVGLTGGASEPWCLVVPDLTKPAFMQPPVPEGTLEGFKEIGRPDLLDVPILAKNHDVKRGRMWSPDPEHWIFLLVSAQTMHGWTIQYAGIARMASGTGSRPALGLAPSLAAGPRFVHDLTQLSRGRSRTLMRFPAYRDDGEALLWLRPWAGDRSAPFENLDPWFIEICRRIRIEREQGRLVAMQKACMVHRLAARELSGVTGDPWTPVEIAKSRAFSATQQGFSYQVLDRLLGDGFEKPVALQSVPGDEAGWIVAAALAHHHKDSKTVGYHERAIPVPAAVMPLFGSSDYESIGARSRDRVARAADVKSCLTMALLELLRGGPSAVREVKKPAGPRKKRDDRPRKWVGDFEFAIDTVFFEQLWGSLDVPANEALHAWERWLVETARRVLHDAFDEAPVPHARRYRAIASADGAFDGILRKKLPHLFETKETA